MAIQIYHLKKNFDVQKAERWFKERRVAYQLVDMKKARIGPRELENIARAVGGLDELIDMDSPQYKESVLRYTSSPERRKELLLENPALLRTPIVRNASLATVGFAPQVWEGWATKA